MEGDRRLTGGAGQPLFIMETLRTPQARGRREPGQLDHSCQLQGRCEELEVVRRPEQQEQGSGGLSSLARVVLVLSPKKMAYTTLQATAAVQFRGKLLLNNEYAEVFYGCAFPLNLESYSTCCGQFWWNSMRRQVFLTYIFPIMCT